MFPSLEVRWFYEGTVPVQVLEWFHAGKPTPVEQPLRVDKYLRLGDTDALGIKLREGRIEIKQRQRQHGVIRFHDRVAGLAEHWLKWSFAPAEAAADWAGILVPTRSWISVRKERALSRYQIFADGRSAAASVDEYLQQGCHLELTRIQAEDQTWWSLAFEAFGDEASLRRNLLTVVEQVFARAQVPFPLAATDSYGYPRWLVLLEQGVGDRIRGH